MKISYRYVYSSNLRKSVFRDNCVVEGQDYDIMDLLRRFSRGERLRVSERPINILESGDHDEDFRNIVPQLDDIVELEEYQKDLQYNKRSLEERRRSKRSEATESSDNDDKTD